MILTVTSKVTRTGKAPTRFPSQQTITTRKYYCSIKIDKVTVVYCCALYGTDTMGIVADVARGTFTIYMLSVFSKTIVSQDTISVMARITQCVYR